MGENNSICLICKIWQPNIFFIKNPKVCVDCLPKLEFQTAEEMMEETQNASN